MIPFFSQINPSDFGFQSLKYKLLFWDLFSFGVEPQVKISVELSQVETLRQQETGGGGGGLICTLCMKLCFYDSIEMNFSLALSYSH